jgi:hypothetical protein
MVVPFAQAAFIPHVVLVDGRPVLLMTCWEAVLALFEVRSNPSEDDPLARVQELAVRCALGLIERSEAVAQAAAKSDADAPLLVHWLELCLDASLARPLTLRAARILLERCAS